LSTYFVFDRLCLSNYPQGHAKHVYLMLGVLPQSIHLGLLRSQVVLSSLSFCSSSLFLQSLHGYNKGLYESKSSCSCSCSHYTSKL